MILSDFIAQSYKEWVVHLLLLQPTEITARSPLLGL